MFPLLNRIKIVQSPNYSSSDTALDLESYSSLCFFARLDREKDCSAMELLWPVIVRISSTENIFIIRCVYPIRDIFIISFIAQVDSGCCFAVPTK